MTWGLPARLVLCTWQCFEVVVAGRICTSISPSMAGKAEGGEWSAGIAAPVRRSEMEDQDLEGTEELTGDQASGGEEEAEVENPHVGG